MDAAKKRSAQNLAAKIKAERGSKSDQSKKVGETSPDRRKRITKEEVNTAPWKFTADQYQEAHGVKQPWIAEISPMQMGLSSERQKKKYAEERSREWEASAAIKQEWGDKVWSAYKSGKIKDSDLPNTGGSGYFGALDAYHLVQNRKAAEKKQGFDARVLEARKVNDILDLDTVAVGDRIFDLMTRDYRVVTKKNKASVVAVSESGKERKVQRGAVQWKSYGDLISAVKNGESIAPTREKKES